MSEPIIEPFPFDDFCGCCAHMDTDSCPFNGKVDALTRYKNLGCTKYEQN